MAGGLGSRHHLVQVGVDAIGRRGTERERQVAGFGQGHVARLDDDRRVPYGCLVELPGLERVRPHGVDVRALGEQRAVEDRIRARGAGTHDVGVGHRFGRAHRCAEPSRRGPIHQCLGGAGDLETTTSSSIGRTARIASRCEFACTPAPKTTSRWASGAARNRVASAETAAVRIAVSDDPSITARERLRRRVEQHVRRLDERQARLRILRGEGDEFHAQAFVAERRHQQDGAAGPLTPTSGAARSSRARRTPPRAPRSPSGRSAAGGRRRR